MYVEGAGVRTDLGRNAARVRSELAVSIRNSDDEWEPHKIYRKEKDQYILPRYYAQKVFFADVNTIDPVYGDELVTHTEKPIELWDYQEPFVEQIVNVFANGGCDLQVKAGTGKGKTIMSLEVARRLGLTTCIVVDQEFLKDQWIEAAKKFLGYTDDQIGLIQGKVCSYEGKPITIAMVQTLFRGTKIEPHVLAYFGTVIFDEAHVIGAPQFGNVLYMFPARYRLGVTATPRDDAMKKVVEAHLGPAEIKLEHKHRKSVVRILDYPGVVSWYANISPKTGRYITELSSDGARNLLIVQAVKALYDTGRKILVISDRIDHIENLIAMFVYAGIPEDQIAQITGKQRTWGYIKDLKPPRRPIGWEEGAEYTPVKLGLIEKKVPRAVLKERKEGDYAVKGATYSMFTKGVDVPDLSAGIDATPRTKAAQVHGRILRDAGEGKLTPIWVTLHDVNSYRAVHQLEQRIRDYSDSNSEIYLWNLEKNQVQRRDAVDLRRVLTQRVAALKEARIETNADGNNIILMKRTGKR